MVIVVEFHSEKDEIQYNFASENMISGLFNILSQIDRGMSNIRTFQVSESNFEEKCSFSPLLKKSFLSMHQIKRPHQRYFQFYLF